MPSEITSTAPRVFVSYSHDSTAHCERMLELCDALRIAGIDATIDQYEMAPNEGWPRWMLNRIEEADFVLIACTETYSLRFLGKGGGKGVKWEGAIVTQDLYETEGGNEKFIPILLQSGDTAFIPKILRPGTYYDLSASTEFDLTESSGFELLYRRLTAQPLTPRGPIGRLTPLPPKRRLGLRESRDKNEDTESTPQATGKQDDFQPARKPLKGQESLHREVITQDRTKPKEPGREANSASLPEVKVSHAKRRTDRDKQEPKQARDITDHQESRSFFTKLMTLILASQLLIVSWEAYRMKHDNWQTLSFLLTAWLLAFALPWTFWGPWRHWRRNATLNICLILLCSLLATAFLVLKNPQGPNRAESRQTRSLPPAGCDGSTKELLCDDFGGYKPGWKEVRGRWEYLINRDGFPFISQLSDFQRERNALKYYDQLGIGDAEISTLVQMEIELPQIPIQEDDFKIRRARKIAGAGIVFRLVDENNYYMFRLAGLEGAVLGKMVDGEWRDLANPRSINFFGSRLRYSDRWYRLRVLVRGNQIECSIGEWAEESQKWLRQEVTVANIEDYSFNTGRVGLATFQARGNFSYIRIVRP